MKRLKIVEKTSPKPQIALKILATIMNVCHDQPGKVYERNISLGVIY